MAKRYRGKWVALKKDRITVVASGTNVQQVLDAARMKGEQSPIITRMPTTLRRFVGSLQVR